ncbi:S-layer homology domain-containing protein [Sporosarcina sp. P1]|uniref:S-layer homology domain-containing protein n=1 Tax=Sporosarcina sp. P1 TaxID=2048257 RepID=UPI0013043FB2|nr:S-layer homology domain-containing protein [Sporosarcina sp. P1]
MAIRSKQNQLLIALVVLVVLITTPISTSAKGFLDTENSSHEKAIVELVEQGVISGYPDGTFKPNKTISRSDVVKMMGKWLVSLGYDIPEDYQTKPRFTDSKQIANEELLKYAALVKDQGVFNGQADGSLNPTGEITRENMAIVLVRAYNAIHKTDLVGFVAKQTFTRDVKDLGKAKLEARSFIDVLDFFDITNPVILSFNPKNTTTRGQFATFLYKTASVPVPPEEDKPQPPTDKSPVWQYNGEQQLNVKNGATFTLPAVQAIDYSGKQIALRTVITDNAGNVINEINTSNGGTYTITYSAIDEAGNRAKDLIITVYVALPSPTEEDDGFVIESIT